MQKNVFFIFILVVFTFQVHVTAFAQNLSFTDIQKDYWGYEAITSLKNNGSISGYSDGTFGPNTSITRGEFMKLVVSAFFSYQLEGSEKEEVQKKVFTHLQKIASTSNVKLNFTDLNPDHWAYLSVYFLVSENIISGYDDGTIGINKPITRAEVIKIFIEILGINTLEIANTSLVFSDVNNNEWYNNYLLVARYLGVVNGYNDNTFQPNNTISRAEAAQIVYNFSKINGRGSEIVFNGNAIDFSPLYSNDKKLFVNNENTTNLENTNQEIDTIKKNEQNEIHENSNEQSNELINIIDEKSPHIDIFVDEINANEKWYYVTANKTDEWLSFSIPVEEHKKIYMAYQSERFPQGVFAGQGRSILKFDNNVYLIGSEEYSVFFENDPKFWAEYTKNEISNATRFYKRDVMPESENKILFYADADLVFQGNNLWQDITAYILKYKNPSENYSFALKFQEGDSIGVVFVVKN